VILFFFSEFSPYFNAFTVTRFMQGTIPPCFYELSSLGLLHLSGNGFTGTIPSVLNMSLALRDISLSHNLLTGTIPREIQLREWFHLDLSYNKLDGTLSSWFHKIPVNGSLSLEVNRISGNIPSSLLDTQTISILDGNIFQCDAWGTNLPKTDPEYNNYICGSDNVNDILYAWIAVFLVCPVVLFYCYWRYNVRICLNGNTEKIVEQRQAEENCSKSSDSRNAWWQLFLNAVCSMIKDFQKYKAALKEVGMFDTPVIDPAGQDSKMDAFPRTVAESSVSDLARKKSFPHLHRLSSYFEELRKIILILTLYCVCILLPIYSILKRSYSSYQLEYAWSISGLLFSGEVVSVCLFLLLLIFVLLIVFLFQRIDRNLDFQQPKGEISTLPVDLSRTIIGESESNCRLTAHSPISSNSGGRPQPQSPLEQLKISSVNEILVMYSIIIVLDVIIVSIADFSYVYVVLTYDFLINLLTAWTLAVFRLLSNRILLSFAIPFVRKKVLLVKMKYLKLSKDEEAIAFLNEPYQFRRRDISMLENLMLFNNIVIPVIAVLFILPDCFYNALFAASNVTSSYEYTTCYQYLVFQGTGRLCQRLVEDVTYSPPFIYSFQCSSKIIINYVSVYIFMFIIVSLLLPLMKILCKLWHSRLTALSTSSAPSSAAVHLQTFLERFILPEYYKPLKAFPGRFSDGTVPALFAKLQFAVSINSYLTIFVAFGALFPPLAIIACFSVYSLTYYEELSIGWLLIQSRKTGYFWYEEQLEKECARIEKSSNLTIWSTLFVSCCLFGYIIFDTMGDTNGWKAALPMTVLMICLPIVLLLIVSFIRRTEKQKSFQQNDLSSQSQVPNPLLFNDEIIESKRTSLQIPRNSEIQLGEF
jgi:hypothetical protein